MTAEGVTVTSGPRIGFVTRTGRTVAALVEAVRPRQWVKNVLVIGAPLAAGRMLEPTVLRSTAIAFIAFCLAASCTYLVNDVHDLREDRLHPVKCRRPIARGDLGSRTALVVAAGLATGALALTLLASRPLVLVVAGYLVMTVSYSLRLRREPVLELVAVAAGFVLRGAGGGAAADLDVSSWFLLVAGFGSLFLVAGKRYSERIAERPAEGTRASLGFYTPGYLRFIWASAANLTVITYALWADQVYRVRQEGTWALWSVLPFLLGVLCYAREIDSGAAEAPETLVLQDRTLQLLGVAWLALFAAGTVAASSAAAR